MNELDFRPTASLGPDRRRPRMLLVDDHVIHLQTLHQALKGESHLFMATNGTQALALCREKMPDLVLLDVEMPDMSGLEVCERLKADPLTQHIPVIFISAHQGPEMETNGLDRGAVDFIAKPFNRRVVQARVKTHLLLKMHNDLLRERVFLDGLTGVHNRRLFDERLEMEWARAQRSGAPLSLILLDVDHFKRYNDHYGHLAGDDCLKLLAQLARQVPKRPADLFARYGGEEFACLLPETPLEAAVDLAHQIEQAVAAQALPTVVSDVGPHVTVSLGVATRRGPHPGAPAALVAAADHQLYQAKQTGRGRVCHAPLTGSDTPGVPVLL